MNPEWSGFALGLLFGAAKIMAIGTVGFGIAWWRARVRIRKLEAERLEPAEADERLVRLEQSFDYVAGQLDQLMRSHAELNEQLAAAAAVRQLREPHAPLAGDPRPGQGDR